MGAEGTLDAGARAIQAIYLAPSKRLQSSGTCQRRPRYVQTRPIICLCPVPAVPTWQTLSKRCLRVPRVVAALDSDSRSRSQFAFGPASLPLPLPV